MRDEHDILDAFKNHAKTDADLKRSERKFALFLLIAIVFNCLIFTLFYEGDFLKNLYTAFMGLVIGFTAIGFALGAIFALIPYHQFSYRKRYFRTALLTNLVIQSIYAVMLSLLPIISWLKSH